MAKKVITLILAGYLFSIIQSCCINEYDCRWTGFEFQIINNSGKEPTIWDGNSIINKKAFGFRISMKDTVLYVAQRFSMIDECRATSCGIRLRRLHAATSIVIKTIYDYSDFFPANSDITSLFRARISENIKEDYATINDVISYINDPSNNSYYKKTDDFDLYLIDNTCIGGQQKFEINIFLSDGTILKKQTDDLLLE